MSLLLTQRPLRDVGEDDLSTILESTWVALHNPIIWKWTRKDFVVDDIVVTGTLGTITLSSPDAEKFNLIETGDLVYISNSTVTGTFVVMYTSGSDTINIFLEDAPFANGTYGGGYVNNNSLAGYRLEVAIWVYQSDPTEEELLALTTWQPFTDGTVTIDISSWLKRELTIQDRFDYRTEQYVDIDAFAGFHFKIRERFTDEYEIGIWVSDTYDYYWVNASKQIQDAYGQNMAKYVPFPDSSEWLAKWLTKFPEPVYFPGFPFDVAFIISAELVGIDLEYLQVAYDVNGDAELLVPVQGIDNTIGVNRMNVFHNNIGYTKTLKIKQEGVNHPYTDLLTVHVYKECPDFPVYLKWLNSLGGWSYWLFGFDQQKSISVGDAVMMQRVVEELSTADSLLETISKSAVPKLVAGANAVSAENIRGLRELFTSPKVYCLMNPNTWASGGEDEDGDPVNPWPDAYLDSEIQPRWQVVNIPTGSFPLESTRTGKGDVEVTIQFQELNIQAQ